MRINHWLTTLVNITWPPITVAALHLIRMLLMPKAYDMDMLAHLLGGVSIAWMTKNVYMLLRQKNFLPTLPRWLEWQIMIATTALVGVLWEFWEFYLQNVYFNDMGLTLMDTELDLVLDLVGATVFASVWIASRDSKRQSKR